MSIYNVEGTGLGTESARDLTFGREDWQNLCETEEVSFGGLQAVTQPASLVGEEKDLGDDSTSQVILSSGRETVNGLLKITYDPEAVTLTDAAGATELYSICKSQGELLFGYASLQSLDADTALGALTFRWNDGAGNETRLQVEVLEENDGTNAGVETLTLRRACNHDHLELRDAREATCFAAGYTGDTYCTDCGALVEPGQPIPISCPSLAYEDLDTSKWYHPYTDCVIENRLMVGDGAYFWPNATVTRAMMVQTLYNLVGRPAAGGDSGFLDVSPDKWYAEAITWARENGIVFGMDNTHFAPERPVARQEAVTMLYRYVKDYCKAGMAGGTALTAFRDEDQVAAYARPAMEWAVAVNLVRGVGESRIAPRDNTLRCQLVTLLTILDRDILK